MVQSKDIHNFLYKIVDELLDLKRNFAIDVALTRVSCPVITIYL